MSAQQTHHIKMKSTLSPTASQSRSFLKTLYIVCIIITKAQSLSCIPSPRPRIPILQYHNNWVAVNKPSGLSTHAGGRNNNKRVSTLKSRLRRQLDRKVFPVHRLDHRTSGLILFAFDSDTCSTLHKALTAEQTTKEYIALLRGEWWHESRVVLVDQPLLMGDGFTKDAVTKFTLLASQTSTSTSDEDCTTMAASLVLCQPLTGRTHQIRRHASRYLGQPILGDTQHGDSRVNRWWRQKKGLDRLALHALSIQGDGLSCVAPITSELRNVLQSERGLWDEAVSQEPRLLLDDADELGGTHGRFYRNRTNIQNVSLEGKES